MITKQNIDYKKQTTYLIKDGFLPKRCQNIIRAAQTNEQVRKLYKSVNKIKDCWSPNRSQHISNLQFLALKSLMK